ncbi:MAG TPA: hypothetical protein K8W04_00815, partial [Bacteroides reticulotermitis]|nr:hypothetical protein [Bacteroides reticulotermitis]
INTVGKNVYKTHYYPTSTSDAMECWMVENSIEGIGSGKGYGLDWAGANIGNVDSSETRGQINGYYYAWGERNNACPEGWSVPTNAQLEKLAKRLHLNTDGVWWAYSRGVDNNAFAGYFINPWWSGWVEGAQPSGSWWTSSSTGTRGLSFASTNLRMRTADKSEWLSVRCVKD